MILIAYDGSPDAKAAIEHAGTLFAGQDAIVLTIWQPFVEVVRATAWGYGAPLPDGIDITSEQSARSCAEDGAELARQAGLTAEPCVTVGWLSLGDAILRRATEFDADAIVIGSRGLGGLKSLLLGSVSHAVLQHADRPVVVIPSADVAAGRTNRALSHQGVST